MPQLEPLNLKLTGSADGLTTSLGKAERDVRGFGHGVGMVGSRFAGLSALAGPAGLVAAGALAAVAAAAAGAAMAIRKVSEEFRAIDETVDAANRLGVAFNELKGLRFSLGKVTGAEDNEIEQAVTKLQVNLGEAARKGEGEVHDALVAIGLDAKRLLAAGPQEAIETLAEKISQVGDKSRQLQLVYDILGKSGLKIAAAFRESPEGLREANDWLQKNATLTAQQVEQVGAANDAWDKTSAKITGIFQKIAAEVAPLLQVIADDVLEFADGFEHVEGWAKQTVDVVAQLYGIVKDIFEIVTSPAFTVGNLLEGDFKGAAKTIKEALKLDGAIEAQADLVKARESAAQNAAKRPKGVSEAETAALEATSQASEATKKAAAAVEERARKVESQAKAQSVSPLGAVTDRAEQLRKVAELQSQRAANQYNEKMLAAQNAGNAKLDRILAAIRFSGALPPIALD